MTNHRSVQKILVVFIVSACISALSLPRAMAAEYYCEVMTLKGAAFVTSIDSVRKAMKQGDLLKIGDLVEVEKDGQVDLAFDKEWSNITRIWESSRVKIKSIYPTGLGLDRGDVFAKLGKLPKGTTFEIQTPTAIAAVRGTEFLTSVSEKGLTSVVSYQHSVEVFNLDSNGGLGAHVIVRELEKTTVPRINEPPAPPVKAPESDIQRISAQSSDVANQVKEAVQEGRFAQVQSAGSVEAMMKLSEAYKKTEEAQKENNKGSSDERKPAGNDGDGGGPGGGNRPGGGDLSPERVKLMKDLFIRAGGDPKDFKLDDILKAGMDPDKINMEPMKKIIDHPDSLSPRDYSPAAQPGPNDKPIANSPTAGNPDRNNPGSKEPSPSYREPPSSPKEPPSIYREPPSSFREPFHGDAPPSVQRIESELGRPLNVAERERYNACAQDPRKCSENKSTTGNSH